MNWNQTIPTFKGGVGFKFGGNVVDLGSRNIWGRSQSAPVWGYNRYTWYTHKPVSPLMGSEAPCWGGGLSGNCLLIIHFIFQFLTTPKSNIFPFSLNFKHLPPTPLNFTNWNIRKIIQKFTNNYWTKDCNLIESLFDWMKSYVEINEK